MNAAIYARVSTTDQRNELQIRELTEYVERRGWILAGIYQDQMSGAKAQRGGLDALMADARLRKFDAVVVWKLDRYGRSLIHCVGAIQELTSTGVRFVATSQGLDTDTSNPTWQLLLHVLAAVAQFERQLIKERVSAGLKNAKAKGVKIGRPRVVFDRRRALRDRWSSCFQLRTVSNALAARTRVDGNLTTPSCVWSILAICGVEARGLRQTDPQNEHVIRERSMRWEIVTEGQDADVEAFAEYVRILFDQDTVIWSAYEVKTRYVTRSRETGTKPKPA